MSIKVKDSMKAFLSPLVKKKESVYIVLNSGKEYLGVVSKVGDFLMVLQQKGKRDFYDAVIRIDDISVVELKVRG